ncbi:sulfatase [Engelhardtia mirabilis]|uniref:Choline-sulfatase n=1 Tax=Engelhardtia mirabilis TaxID=2528011 RepID=A0A518BGG3_9BACT|nr:Choline-sulfatase [Planctomycetes bacterium Pla133]QDV00381.1 Choline-sulfatase [Planctomycetes bacterium Pla86]
MSTDRRRSTANLAAGLLLAALAALVGSCGSEAPAQRPNLLLVVFDTTRADHLSTYGYGRETSPTVDALGARGLVCEQVWSQASLTPVSASSFLTGAYPYRTGVRSLYMVGREELSSEVVTLAELLSDEGWSTAGFVSAPPMGARYGLDRGFQTWNDDTRKGARARAAMGLGNEYQRRADDTADLALEWLDGAVGEDRPFALMVHFFDSHDATLVPPREFLAPRVSFDLPGDLDQRGHLREVRRDEDRIELYDAEIAFQDAQLARLIAALDRAGRADDTLVCLIADHGEGLGQHDFWTHGLLWGEQLHVPWVMAGPGLPAGARLAQRVRLVDLFPTVVELLGVDLPDGLAPDGRSILPLLNGTVPDEPAEVYAEAHHAPNDGQGRDTRLYSLTAGKWKYVHRPDGENHELYDLEQDPGETRNLFTPDQPVARALRAELERRGAVRGVEGSTEHLDADTIEMLRELGYL